MISPIPCSNEKCTLDGLPASRIVAHVLHLKLPQLARIHSWHSSPAEGSPVFTGSTLVRSPFTWTTSTLIAIPWSTEPPSAGYRYSGIVITISLAWSVCASVQSQVYDIDGFQRRLHRFRPISLHLTKSGEIIQGNLAGQTKLDLQRRCVDGGSHGKNLP